MSESGVADRRSWTMPTCKSGSSRHADRMSRAGKLVLDCGQRQLSDGWQFGRHHDIRSRLSAAASKSAASQRLWLSVIRRDSSASTSAERSSSCSTICAVSCWRYALAHGLSEGVLREEHARGRVQDRLGGYARCPRDGEGLLPHESETDPVGRHHRRQRHADRARGSCRSARAGETSTSACAASEWKMNVRFASQRCSAPGLW